jgi:hypothetical protein
MTPEIEKMRSDYINQRSARNDRTTDLEVLYQENNKNN